MYIDLHVKYPLLFSDFNGTCTFWRGFEEFQISNCIKIRPMEAELHAGGWTGGRMDRQTDRQTDRQSDRQTGVQA